MKFQPFQSSFKLTPEEIDRCIGHIDETLAGFNIEKHSHIRLRIAAEEVMLTWREALGEEADCSFSIRKKFGAIQLIMSTKGECVEPAAYSAEALPESNAGTQNILSMLGIAPAFTYENGCNIVVFSLKRKQLNPILALLYAAVAAVVIGLICRQLPADSRVFVAEGVVAPVFSAFMRCLSAISGPMMFLAVVWGIFNVGDIATFGRIGKRLVGRFLLLLFGVSALTILVNLFFYNIDLSSANAGGGSAFNMIFNMLLEIIPGNIFAPFIDGNALQIVFLAICIGLAMLMLSKKAGALADIVEQSNGIVELLMGIIAKLVPLFIFCNIISVVLSGNISTLVTAVKFFVTFLGTLVFLFIIFACSVGLRYHVSPLKLLKKSSESLSVAITTASSSAAFSVNMSDCTKKIGIDKKLANFGLPLGMILFKNGNSVCTVILALYTANLYDVPITASFLVTLLLLAPILSVASPPIPGGSLTIFVILFSQLGIPPEAVAMATMINTLADFPGTALNVFGLQMELVITAGKLGLLDEKKLRKP